MSKDKKEHQFLPDAQNEGRDQLYVDVDRMVNEGMSGGSVHMRADYTNIEEAIDFFPEDEPKEI
ncbi:hypothetical protein ACFFF5_05870 [Lederbergia wuyishanensis]|uniref:Uncharacterized protein n=1 Tax=Lederbergia wuyishanensis TaxID=1347903 RepID=A0ABU0CYN9_9BACI|nr:hypothetical protein [Lederbergia wuyishanensis]MCJ8005889.1 hypothetical protein [Lederbergia wuyishanensis]MDQ0341254.1 hypothetical protein [Lederbergia wuyishanensis]